MRHLQVRLQLVEELKQTPKPLKPCGPQLPKCGAFAEAFGPLPGSCSDCAMLQVAKLGLLLLRTRVSRLPFALRLNGVAYHHAGLAERLPRCAPQHFALPQVLRPRSAVCWRRLTGRASSVPWRENRCNSSTTARAIESRRLSLHSRLSLCDIHSGSRGPELKPELSLLWNANIQSGNAFSLHRRRSFLLVYPCIRVEWQVNLPARRVIIRSMKAPPWGSRLPVQGLKLGCTSGHGPLSLFCASSANTDFEHDIS